MLEGRIKDILTQLLPPPGEVRLLLAVSGGKDSMVLLHLLQQSAYDFGIGHCNFKLRGAASDADEQFVREYAHQHDIPFHTIAFDTLSYAKEHKQSVEMAARTLRYSWFEELCKTASYSHILTGHHRSDRVETFFININRGSGIRGLCNMQWMNNTICRPLLDSSRASIDAYQKKYAIPYREDASNQENIYLRNAFRNQLMPVAESINSRFEDSVVESMNYLQDALGFIDNQMGIIRSDVLKDFAERKEICLSKLLDYGDVAGFILFELLRPYGFKGELIQSILLAARNKHTGKQFLSHSYRLLVDRECLIIKELLQVQEGSEEQSFFIDEKLDAVSTPEWKLELYQLSCRPDDISEDPNSAVLDMRKIAFPLELRKWREGDVFQPLGMKGRKKISDFLIDKKVPLFEKENTWVLCSGEDIIWVVGHRIDNRYKITSDSIDCLLAHKINEYFS